MEDITKKRFENDNEKRDYESAYEIYKKREEHLDKIRGCIFGGAIGDALGYPVEFLREDSIFSEYGKKGIQEYELDSESGKALISDDTQMTLFTANGLLCAETRGMLRGIGGDPVDHVQLAYLDWLETQDKTYEERMNDKKESKVLQRCGFNAWLSEVRELYNTRATGNTCLSALASQRDDRKSYYGIDEPLNDSKGCGGIMRIAPVALRHKPYSDDTYDIEKIDETAAEIAAITHGHPLGYMPAAVLAHIINRVVYPKKELTLRQIINEALSYISSIFKDNEYLYKLIKIIDLAMDLSENDKSDLENINKIGQGWVAEETLAISIYCALRHKDDFSGGIIAAVNHKGDSDSTGAVTGNLLGALLGFDAIEGKWKKDLELADIILEISDDLCHGCLLSEYSHYEDDEWERKYLR